jgi:uridylate kinase
MRSFKRILLKLSGESLQDENGSGIGYHRLEYYGTQIKQIHNEGIQVGIVIGGGNIFRGMQGKHDGFDRVIGDQMGMLATVINGMAIFSMLEKMNVPVRLFSALRVEPVAEMYSPQRAKKSLEKGEVCILTAGTGNPFFTTDTAAALRGVEINADVLLKGTRVDGVYTADPEKDPEATLIEHIEFDEIYQKGLKIMDLTAFTLCKENQLPVVVFNMNTEGNLLRIIRGEAIGSFIHP